MRNRISFRRVIRELPEIGIGLLIATGISMTVISLFFAIAEVLS